MSKGKITRIIGPVVDFQFETGQLPDQGHAVNLVSESGENWFLKCFNTWEMML